MAQKSIGIIGAGVAGLQTARALTARGFRPTIFEKSNEIGGVWKSNFYGVQVPKQLYEFPGFPYDPSVKHGEFPSGDQVQTYIKSYVAQNKLRDVISLNTKITKVSRNNKKENKGWTFHYLKDGKQHEQHFDYCVMATGMYSLPEIPIFQGQSEFESTPGNKVLHSSQLTTKHSAAPSDKVVVLGGAKSAFDCALDMSKYAQKSTLIQRHVHWAAPRKIAGVIPFQYVFLSRFGQGLVSVHVGAWPPSNKHVLLSNGHKMLHRLITPPIFRIVEALFAFQLGYPQKPSVDIVKDFYGYAHIMGTDFKHALKSNKVELITDTVQKLSKKGVVLSSGKEIECNTIVCATGFKRDYSVFDDETLQALDVQHDGLYLYKHMIPPRVPDLAFIGSEVASISNICTSYIQSEWLARLLKGDIVLPDTTTMSNEVEESKTWKRSWMPDTASRANLVLLHQIHYHDSLVEDMKLNRKLKSNMLSELFMPYQPQDYSSLQKHS